MKRIPSLDGLRGISIVIVIISHLILTPNFDYNFLRILSKSFLPGDLGVNIFFVISGYIISKILLAEETAKKGISLKKFYIRRMFRILPVYYLYILVVFISTRFQLIADLDVKSFWPALTFTTSLIPEGIGWTLGHSWSLSTEEQFYLIWPIIMFFIKDNSKRNVFIIASIILVPILRALFYLKYNTIPYAVFGRGDCIFMGCYIALNQTSFTALYARYNQKLWGLPYLTLALVLIFNLAGYHKLLGFLTVPFTNTLHGIFSCFLIFKYVINPEKEGLFGYKLLNSKVFTTLGLYSYALYIWQQFFLQNTNYSPHWWKQFPINLVPVVLAAFASYHLVERPFLKLQKSLFA